MPPNNSFKPMPLRCTALTQALCVTPLFRTVTMANLNAGELIKLRKIDLEKIQYRDWIGEREPAPGDVAKVVRVFDGNPVTYQLCCEPREGFIVWGVQVDELSIEYEIVG
jgi:hypothetical protein